MTDCCVCRCHTVMARCGCAACGGHGKGARTEYAPDHWQTVPSTTTPEETIANLRAELADAIKCSDDYSLGTFGGDDAFHAGLPRQIPESGSTTTNSHPRQKVGWLMGYDMARWRNEMMRALSMYAPEHPLACNVTDKPTDDTPITVTARVHYGMIAQIVKLEHRNDLRQEEQTRREAALRTQLDEERRRHAESVDAMATECEGHRQQHERVRDEALTALREMKDRPMRIPKAARDAWEEMGLEIRHQAKVDVFDDTLEPKQDDDDTR